MPPGAEQELNSSMISGAASGCLSSSARLRAVSLEMIFGDRSAFAHDTSFSLIKWFRPEVSWPVPRLGLCARVPSRSTWGYFVPQGPLIPSLLNGAISGEGSTR